MEADLARRDERFEARSIRPKVQFRPLLPHRSLELLQLLPPNLSLAARSLRAMSTSAARPRAAAPKSAAPKRASKKQAEAPGRRFSAYGPPLPPASRRCMALASNSHHTDHACIPMPWHCRRARGPSLHRGREGPDPLRPARVVRPRTSRAALEKNSPFKAGAS